MTNEEIIYRIELALSRARRFPSQSKSAIGEARTWISRLEARGVRFTYRLISTLPSLRARNRAEKAPIIDPAIFALVPPGSTLKPTLPSDYDPITGDFLS